MQGDTSEVPDFLATTVHGIQLPPIATFLFADGKPDTSQTPTFLYDHIVSQLQNWMCSLCILCDMEFSWYEVKDIYYKVFGPYVYITANQLYEARYELLLKALRGCFEPLRPWTGAVVRRSEEAKKLANDIKLSMTRLYDDLVAASDAGLMPEKMKERVLRWRIHMDVFLGHNIRWSYFKSCYRNHLWQEWISRHWAANVKNDSEPPMPVLFLDIEVPQEPEAEASVVTGRKAMWKRRGQLVKRMFASTQETSKSVF